MPRFILGRIAGLGLDGIGIVLRRGRRRILYAVTIRPLRCWRLAVL